MGSPPSPSVSPMPQERAQFSAELEAEFKGEDSKTSLTTTQVRHEIPEQKPHYAPNWHPFSIVSDQCSLSSGFPYNSRLRELRITPDQWLQFTTEVVKAAKLTFMEDAAAWSTGITTGTLSSAVLLVFGPVAGYYAGKSIHRKTVISKVTEKLAVEGPLRMCLRQWNQTVFMEKGVQMWLEPPTRNGEVIIDAPAGATPKEIAKLAKRQGSRFRFVCMPYDPRNPPIGTDHSPTSPLEGGGSWSTGQSPTSPSGGHDLDGKLHEAGFEPVEVDSIRPPAEVDSIRPAAELGINNIPRKKLNPSPAYAFELDGSSVEVKKADAEKVESKADEKTEENAEEKKDLPALPASK